jgi:quercetin dioxygenase-like cupin family protein
LRLFQRAPDGGEKSGVTGFFLIEMKSSFSVVLLRFSPGTREAYHSHAFNAITFWLKGRVIEEQTDGTHTAYPAAGRVKWTPRSCFHRVRALETTWALSFRGPWANQWSEHRNGELVTLTHGRKVI